jgi:phospholipase C
MKSCAHRSLNCISSPLALVLLFPFLLVFTGCGGATFKSSSSPAMPTVSIAASPGSINTGSSSMLSVAASNASGVTVAGSDGSSYSMPASGGTQAVSPTATTTYTATATGTGGKASSATSVTVVAAAPPAPTVTISANPTSITAGSSSTLTVAATNATAVTVTGSDGSSYNLSPSGGKQAVSPSATTTYTANATGAGGKASAVAGVTVTAVVTPGTPTVAISANPASITAGSSSTLTVSATNATAVTVTGSDGSSYNLPASGGSQVVSPAATTTYTANATGAGGTTSAKAVVTVTTPTAMPTVTLVANPTSITGGGSSTLTVTASNAMQVTVSGSDGSSYNLAATGGVQAVSPATTTTYTANATGTGGKASAVATVTVVAATPPPPAPTVTIAANPTSITAGGSSTLTVAATNATTVKIAGSDGSSYNLSPGGGTQAVTPAGSTTYTVTASGAGGMVTAVVTVTVVAVAPPPAPTVTITAAPTTVVTGNGSTLTVVAANAATVVVTGTDGSSYNLPATGGTQAVTPAATTTYTGTATGTGGTVSATATVTVTPAGSIQSINHVIFMLQENHTFDDYFGMLNNYRNPLGWNIGDDGNNYQVDGIDDKLKTTDENDSGVSFPLFKLRSTCIDDDSSDWLASFGDVNRYNFLTTRPMQENGFVHTAEGYATNCANAGYCIGQFTDVAGQRAMGYYDEGYLNYYYYMAAQFAVSDRWFSPMASKSTPNRIATFTGGTTQGLVRDPSYDDHLGALPLPSIFQALDNAGVSWRLYYTQTIGGCLDGDDCAPGSSNEPATSFGYINYYHNYEYINPTHATCTGTTQPSSVVGDPNNSFCIDPTHIAKLSTYYSDLANGTLASFTFIESGSINDEHPGSGQNVLVGQAEVASIINAFMASSSWQDGVFFFSYDEGGGPYDHVPPVPGHSNDFTAKSMGAIPDIGSIVVNPDSYFPCSPSGGTPTQHCDLVPNYPGTHPGDAATVHGFAAQTGFRLPNMVISPFTRRHYVSHIPMDHTAVIKFVENRFIGPNAHLTARDAVQPDLLDFFDFNNVPWATPPVPPAPVTVESLGYNPCTAGSMGP